MFDEDFISLFPMKDIQTINDVDSKIKNDSKFEYQIVGTNYIYIYIHVLLMFKS